jgi:hypothetical protein
LRVAFDLPRKHEINHQFLSCFRGSIDLENAVAGLIAYRRQQPDVARAKFEVALSGLLDRDGHRRHPGNAFVIS